MWDADLVVPNTGDDKKISLWRIDVNILAVLVAMKDNGDREVNSFLNDYLHFSVSDAVSICCIIVHIKSLSQSSV